MRLARPTVKGSGPSESFLRCQWLCLQRCRQMAGPQARRWSGCRASCQVICASLSTWATEWSTRVALWPQGDDVLVGGVSCEDLHCRRLDNGPRRAPPETRRLPAYSFRGLPSRQSESGYKMPRAAESLTQDSLYDKLARLSPCETSCPVAQRPWPLRSLDSPVSTDAPPPGMQWLMESSGAPLPPDTACLVTPGGLAGFVWRSDRWEVFPAVDAGGAFGA